MKRPDADLAGACARATRARHRRWIASAVLALAIASGIGSRELLAEETTPTPSLVRLRITHRVFAQFQDTVAVAMHERRAVGDTEFEFEAVEFYPQFAYIDSTHTVVSLSDEPKNPAFKIRIFNGEETPEDTWAFYGSKIPHFARTSYLAFEVLGFAYRGKVIGDVGGSPPAESAPKPEEKQ